MQHMAGDLSVLQGPTDHSFGVAAPANLWLSDDDNDASSTSRLRVSVLVMSTTAISDSSTSALVRALVDPPSLPSASPAPDARSWRMWQTGSLDTAGMATAVLYDADTGRFLAAREAEGRSAHANLLTLVRGDGEGHDEGGCFCGWRLVDRWTAAPLIVETRPVHRTSDTLTLVSGAGGVVVRQEPGTYTFETSERCGSLFGGTLATGSFTARLILADSPQTTDALAAAAAAHNLRSSELYLSGAPVPLDGILRSSVYWKTLPDWRLEGAAAAAPCAVFEDVTDADAAARLYAHVLVTDATGEAASFACLEAVQTVDSTPPTLELVPGSPDFVIREADTDARYCFETPALFIVRDGRASAEAPPHAALVMTHGGALEGGSDAQLCMSSAVPGRDVALVRTDPSSGITLADDLRSVPGRCYDVRTKTWTAVTDAVTSLRGCVLAADAAGNVACRPAGNVCVVRDRTPPLLLGGECEQAPGTYAFVVRNLTIAKSRPSRITVVTWMEADDDDAHGDCDCATEPAAENCRTLTVAGDPASPESEVEFIETRTRYLRGGRWMPIDAATAASGVRLRAVAVATDAAGNRSARHIVACVGVACRNAPEVHNLRVASALDRVTVLSWDRLACAAYVKLTASKHDDAAVADSDVLWTFVVRNPDTTSVAVPDLPRPCYIHAAAFCDRICGRTARLRLGQN